MTRRHPRSTRPDPLLPYTPLFRSDPALKDGRGTAGLALPKSNWAHTIDEPPFEAYQVGCGITFTFGGLRVDPQTAQVLDPDLASMPGLFAPAELVGGLFYSNHPRGTGLTPGRVSGSTAGMAAAPLLRCTRSPPPA